MIIQDRRFRPLFWTQFLGALNDNFLKNAMVILIEYRGLSVIGLDAPSIVALSGGIFILPFFLFSMVAGQIADKCEKSRLVRLVKFWELGITLISALGFYFHSVGFLLGALFMMGTHSTFFGPIKYSSIPDLVEPRLLVLANAYVEVGTFLAILLGTIGGGVIILLPNGELWISLALNVCALLGLAACWKLPRLPSAADDLRVEWSPFGPLLSSITLLRSRSEVYYAIMCISAFWFFGAAVLSILPPYCKEYLHVDGHVITSFLALYTLGIGIGSLMCARLSRGKVEIGLVPLGAVGMTVFLLDLAFVRPATIADHLATFNEFVSTSYGPRLMVDFLLMSVAAGFFILPLYALMQERSDQAFRSRVIAANNVLNAIFMVVSAVLVMVLHMQGLSVPHSFMILGVMNFLFCLYIFWRAGGYWRAAWSCLGRAR